MLCHDFSLKNSSLVVTYIVIVSDYNIRGAEICISFTPLNLPITILIHSTIGCPDIHRQLNPKSRHIVTCIGKGRLIGCPAEAKEQFITRRAIIKTGCIETIGENCDRTFYGHNHSTQSIYAYRCWIFTILQPEQIIRICPVATAVFDCPKHPMVLATLGTCIRQPICADRWYARSGSVKSYFSHVIRIQEHFRFRYDLNKA